MVTRASWKGFLEIGELVCPVALRAAASSAERVSFHLLNRRTGHRVNRVYLDSETGATVSAEDQVKGYADPSEPDEPVILEPGEIAAAIPRNDKRMRVAAFLPLDGVDTLYLDRPYHLGPAEEAGGTAFAVIRDALATRKVAAVAHALLFRRVRAVLIHAEGKGLLAHTLEFGHELRDPKRAFRDMETRAIDPEMLELATHIIRRKRRKFDPSRFEDRYDDALAALVAAKAAGKPAPKPKTRPETGASDLLSALRDSAKARGGRGKASGTKRRAAPARRKAG